MKLVIQRVTTGMVQVEGNVVGKIDKGVVCLVGLGRDDEAQDMEWCCRRLLVRPAPWFQRQTF